MPTLTFTDSAIASQHPAMIAQALSSAARWNRDARVIVKSRDLNGWLEWTMVIDRRPEPNYVIGIIQRNEGADIETHS